MYKLVTGIVIIAVGLIVMGMNLDGKGNSLLMPFFIIIIGIWQIWKAREEIAVVKRKE